MNADLITVNNILEELSSNLEFINDRRNQHSKIIRKSLSSLEDLTYLKVFIVIVFSIVEIIFFKFVLNGKRIFNKEIKVSNTIL